MVCGQCRGIESFFDEREANRKLRAYRKSGPNSTTRILIDALKVQPLEGKSLLDIGGGVGVIQHELLKSGVREAACVEASTAYIEAGRKQAEDQGHHERIAYYHGDFVDLAPGLEPANIVTLDRVICCYHDVEQLLGLSSGLATEVIGLVFPRSNWLFKAGFRVFNFMFWLRRCPFRIFIHADSTIDSIASSNGLRRRFYRKTLFWQVAVYAS